MNVALPQHPCCFVVAYSLTPFSPWTRRAPLHAAPLPYHKVPHCLPPFSANRRAFAGHFHRTSLLTVMAHLPHTPASRTYSLQVGRGTDSLLRVFPRICWMMTVWRQPGRVEITVYTTEFSCRDLILRTYDLLDMVWIWTLGDKTPRPMDTVPGLPVVFRDAWFVPATTGRSPDGYLPRSAVCMTPWLNMDELLPLGWFGTRCTGGDGYVVTAPCPFWRIFGTATFVKTRRRPCV